MERACVRSGPIHPVMVAIDSPAPAECDAHFFIFLCFLFIFAQSPKLPPLAASCAAGAVRFFLGFFFFIFIRGCGRGGARSDALVNKREEGGGRRRRREGVDECGGRVPGVRSWCGCCAGVESCQNKEEGPACLPGGEGGGGGGGVRSWCGCCARMEI